PAPATSSSKPLQSALKWRRDSLFVPAAQHSLRRNDAARRTSARGRHALYDALSALSAAHEIQLPHHRRRAHRNRRDEKTVRFRDVAASVPDTGAAWALALKSS